MKQNRFTWYEVRDIMYKYNADHNYTTKGTPTHLTAVAVISQDSFDREYSERSRSYAFTSDNKAFIAGQLSNSVFSDCLDGTDNGVRLDWYIHDGWDIDYVYFEEDEEWQEVASKMFAD